MANDPQTIGLWIGRALCVLAVAGCIAAIVHVLTQGPTVLGAILWPGMFLVLNLLWWPRRKKDAQPTAEQVDDMAQQLTTGLAQVAELMEPVTEAAVGYRRKLEAHGYSPTVAEQLAAQYHLMLLQKFGGTS
jgi:membrane protein implicated in regulation of membrane protease activity